MGAGASLPFVTNGKTCLSTQYLTDQISDPGKWDAIYDEFKQNYSAEQLELNFNITVDDILPIIEKLKTINECEITPQVREQIQAPLPQKVEDFYGIGKVNFEHILYLLDKVCNYLYDRKNSIDNIMFDIWGNDDKQRQELQSKKGWNYVPYLCREVLVNAIIEIWESCKKEQAIEVNTQFFTSVLERFESVSIYSLNYDPLIYEAVKQIRIRSHKNNHEIDKTFETGFYESESFNYKKFYYRDNVVAFLHGHIGFMPGGKNYMHFDGNYLDAQKRRISAVACGQGGYFRRGIKGIHYNVSITSGLEKFDSFYDNPYACYIQRFSEDVAESEYIVFIGSGLGDRHVNLFATTAWRAVNGNAEDITNLFGLRKLPDERKKIIIVTSGQATKSFLDLLSLTDIGKGLHGLFEEGIEWNGWVTDSSMKENSYANVNRGLFLYLKGTEQFFKEIWGINDLFN